MTPPHRQLLPRKNPLLVAETASLRLQLYIAGEQRTTENMLAARTRMTAMMVAMVMVLSSIPTQAIRESRLNDMLVVS